MDVALKTRRNKSQTGTGSQCSCSCEILTELLVALPVLFLALLAAVPDGPIAATRVIFGTAGSKFGAGGAAADNAMLSRRPSHAEVPGLLQPA